MITLRPAVSSDLAFLETRAEPPDREVVACQIRNGRLQLIEWDSQPVGLIKTYVLWERLPFMEVLCVEEAKRGQGYGTCAVRLWESELMARGFDLAVISTQAQGTAQHFWRKIGYSDCGLLTTKGNPQEIFMQRALSSAGSV